MGAALQVELLKLRRSRVMLATTVILLLAAALLASAFAAAAGRSGADALTLKARALLPGPGWAGYVSALAQIFATAGLLGMGTAVAWCFGREYADRTIVSLYASATPRAQVATAKLVLLTLWAIAVAIALGPTAVLIALATGLGLPDATGLIALSRVLVLAVLTGLLALTTAIFASVGRGYLPAIAALIGLVVTAQVAVLAGIGSWFPLSAPALWAANNPALPTVSIPQLVLVPITSLTLALVTVAWWRRAPLS